ncbi:hypothetical protein GFS60_08068 (plasmid) [Rhodococcus sp. WAY2]|nr:hypothetical protein GFS60_08068 [Rhodococcus sp. WAY2]
MAQIGFWKNAATCAPVHPPTTGGLCQKAAAYVVWDVTEGAVTSRLACT